VANSSFIARRNLGTTTKNGGQVALSAILAGHGVLGACAIDAAVLAIAAGVMTGRA
jgi:hypothetical protein